MREIPLTQGKIALVDDEDYEKVSQFKWHAHFAKANGRFYAQRNVKLRSYAEARVKGLPYQRIQQMHRFIMGLDFGDPRQVDHKDRNQTLDNRRSNLRVTLRQNQHNVGRRKDNTSGFKGVSLEPNGNWKARIRIQGKQVSVGCFSTREQAAAVYDAAALELHGEFAVTNAMLEAA